LGQAVCPIPLAAWWPPKGGRRIYIYIYNIYSVGSSRFGVSLGREHASHCFVSRHQMAAMQDGTSSRNGNLEQDLHQAKANAEHVIALPIHGVKHLKAGFEEVLHQERRPVCKQCKRAWHYPHPIVFLKVQRYSYTTYRYLVTQRTLSLYSFPNSINNKCHWIHCPIVHTMKGWTCVLKANRKPYGSWNNLQCQCLLPFHGKCLLSGTFAHVSSSRIDTSWSNGDLFDHGDPSWWFIMMIIMVIHHDDSSCV